MTGSSALDLARISVLNELAPRGVIIGYSIAQPGLVTVLSRLKMTGNGPRASFGTLWQLREVICDREPWRFACDVNMKLRSNARVVIQSTERQAIVRGVSVKFADYWGAAYAAKASMIPRGGFVEGNKVLALHPLELRCSYACAASKRGPLGLAAHRAMTIQRSGQRPGDPVSHAAAQATSAYHAHLQRAASRNGVIVTSLATTAFGTMKRFLLVAAGGKTRGSPRRER